MQKRGWYPGQTNDIQAEQVSGKKGKARVIFNRGYLSLYFEIYKKDFSTVVVMVP